MTSPPPVFLSNTCTNSAETRHILLVRSQPYSTIWLSNSTEDRISTSASPNELHSALRIQAFSDHLLLSLWDNVQVTVGEAQTVMPVSTRHDVKSLILLDGNSFISPSGRWEVEFDYDYSISNSMRPPPIPEIREDARLETVSPIDLMIDANHVTDCEEVSDHDIDADETDSKENEAKRQCPVSPRTHLSQLDEVMDTSLDTPEQSDSHSSEPTQQLPKVQNLAQLRRIVSADVDDGHSKQKIDQFMPSTLGAKISRNSDPDIEVPNMSKLHESTVDNLKGPQDAETRAKLSDDKPKSAPHVQAVADSDEGVGDDKITASDTESEDEIKTDSKDIMAVEPTTTDIGAPKFKQLPLKQKKRAGNSAIATTARSTKRRKALPTDNTTSDGENPETPDRPRKKRTARVKLAEVDASISESAPTENGSNRMKNISTRKLARHGMKQSLTDREGAYTGLDDSDTEAGLTDDVLASARRSTRSASCDSRPQPLPLKPKIVLSTSLSNTDKYEKSLRSLGATFVKNIVEADVFCVPDGDLKKTLNLVLSLIYGKYIVTERWLRDCARTKKFGDPQEYMPNPQGHDTSWSLTEALERGRNKETVRLLESWSVFITESLMNELGSSRVTEQAKIARAMGATFRNRLPTQKVKKNVLVMGIKDDPYVNTVRRLGYPLFLREILTMAALRGTLDLDSDEFRVQPTIKEEESD